MKSVLQIKPEKELNFYYSVKNCIEYKHCVTGIIFLSGLYYTKKYGKHEGRTLMKKIITASKLLLKKLFPGTIEQFNLWLE